MNVISNFFSIRSLVSIVLLGAQIYSSQPAVLAKAGTIEPGAQEASVNLTEKQLIGSDVPLLAWTDSSMLPWAALLCIHGFGLHASSYKAFGKRMSHLGIPTYAIDVRGFGTWRKTRENDRVDFDAALLDVRTALSAIRKANPELPVFLLGESMGGAIAIQATADNPTLVNGLVSSVPAGDRFGQKVTTLKVAAAVLRNPDKTINIGQQIVKQATSKPSVASSWQESPHSRMEFSPRELIRFQQFMNQNEAKAKQITSVPVLVFQGGSDRLVKPEGTMAIFKALGTQDKDLHFFGSSEHLIFEEGNFNEKAINDVLGWIYDHSPHKGSGSHKSASSQTDTHEKAGEHRADVSASTAGLAQQRQDAVGHYLIGQGYLKLRDPAHGKEHLLIAMNLARGTRIAQEADKLLLALPPEYNSISTLPSSAGGDHKFATFTGAMNNDKPTVLCFCASWVEQCEPLKAAVKQALSNFGDRINFVRINADDPKNEDVIKQFSVGPLPTVLYLSATNELVSYTVGYSGESGLMQGINKLLSQPAREAVTDESKKTPSDAPPAASP